MRWMILATIALSTRKGGPNGCQEDAWFHLVATKCTRLFKWLPRANPTTDWSHASVAERGKDHLTIAQLQDDENEKAG